MIDNASRRGVVPKNRSGFQPEAFAHGLLAKFSDMKVDMGEGAENPL